MVFYCPYVTEDFKAIFGDPNEAELKRLWQIVHHINEIEKKYQETLKDEYFPAKTAEFKERLQKRRNAG